MTLMGLLAARSGTADRRSRSPGPSRPCGSSTRPSSSRGRSGCRRRPCPRARRSSGGRGPGSSGGRGDARPRGSRRRCARRCRWRGRACRSGRARPGSRCSARCSSDGFPGRVRSWSPPFPHSDVGAIAVPAPRVSTFARVCPREPPCREGVKSCRVMQMHQQSPLTYRLPPEPRGCKRKGRFVRFVPLVRRGRRRNYAEPLSWRFATSSTASTIRGR